MDLFYSAAYVAAGVDFDTTRKAQWIAEALAQRALPNVRLRAPSPLPLRTSRRFTPPNTSPPSGPGYPHLLRHSYATHFLRRGGNPLLLQQILGHASLAMITATYSHLTIADAHVEAMRVLTAG